MDKNKSCARGKTRFRRKPKKKRTGRNYEGVIRKLIDRAVREDTRKKANSSSHQAPDYLLQRIFKECFVIPSVNLGIIDLNSLSIAGDGTKIKTYTFLRGKRYAPVKNPAPMPAI